MSYSLLKRATQRAGLYPLARRAYRSFNPSLARQFNEECALYRQFLRPGDLCFDVGANYGYKTEVFHALGTRVVAFEPQHDCWTELQARTPSATAICAAVGSSVGTATLYVDRHRTGSSVVKGWRSAVENTVTVPMTTLDVEIAKHGLPRFVKIDVEGFDLEVIKGLSYPVPALSFEYHRHRIHEALACLDHLDTVGKWTANVTGAETCHFAATTWMSIADTKAFLGNEVQRAEGFDWGDVFLRSADHS